MQFLLAMENYEAEEADALASEKDLEKLSKGVVEEMAKGGGAKKKPKKRKPKAQEA